MKPDCVLFGSIGTLVETSELQRRAYNLAFAHFDLDWVWEPATYYRMLANPGGRCRVARYAADAGDRVDAAAIHAKKQELFQALLATSSTQPRQGVAKVLAACRDDGIPVGLCTTTTGQQVDAVIGAGAPDISRSSFDWIGTSADVDHPKPAPDIFETALRRLGVDADRAVAIEDTPECAAAALRAGVTVIGFPGATAKGRPFPDGVIVSDRLDMAVLGQRAAMAAE